MPGKPYAHLALAGADHVLTVTERSKRAAIVCPRDKTETMRLDAESPITAVHVHPKVRAFVIC